MPATHEDPTAPVIHQSVGGVQIMPGGPLPPGVAPHQVILRDRVTTATIIPFSAPNQVPISLLAYLCDQLGREIEKGDTYPMIHPLSLNDFGPYWFGVFGAVMLLGEVQDGREIHEMAQRGCDWERECLGSLYIKPNYPGRSSHVCNGGFLVTDASRNRGVGRLMGEIYLDWAPKLGYTYSVFNLVYETNVASCRIWDALGFKRLGRIKASGSLKSYPGELIDAIIYGRDLGQDDDFVSEERFDKIRFYLKNGKYPNGADRAEKSRLRSAATHYKLLPPNSANGERLMLKGKEVISDPQRQYEIARELHHKSHGGINKTTASIAESYHWVRIKETVSQVIRNCPECSEMNKGLTALRTTQQQSRYVQPSGSPASVGATPTRGLPPPPPSQQPLPIQQHSDSPGTDMHLDPTQNSFPGFATTTTTTTTTGQQHNYVMPLDPALMHDLQHPAASSNLENLPPSPFLAASQHMPLAQMPQIQMPQMLQHIELDASQIPQLYMQLHHAADDGADDVLQSIGGGGGDSTMSGLGGTTEEERLPDTRDELRRRLTRAGYRRRRGE